MPAGWLLAVAEDFAVGVIDPAGTWSLADSKNNLAIIGGKTAEIKELLQSKTRSVRQRRLLGGYIRLSPVIVASGLTSQRFVFAVNGHLYTVTLSNGATDIRRQSEYIATKRVSIQTDATRIGALVAQSDNHVATVRTLAEKLGRLSAD